MKRRKSFLPFHLPDIEEAEIRAVARTLRSGWLTTGPRTREFESAFARKVGARHAVALNSGTAALHLALEAVGLQAGDEVLVPTMTFAATAEAVLYFKARPVLVDCRPDTLHIDVEAAARAVTRRTRAIIPVHYAGLPCGMAEILRLARRRGLRVIEDAAHSFPAAYGERPVGSLGDITCFSFHAIKTLTTGEGGMAVTDNARFARRMRLMSLHGINRDGWKRYAAGGHWYYEIREAGFKYNMTDVAASMGLVQLRRAEALWRRRRALARRYQEGLSGVDGLILPGELPGRRHAWHLFVLQLLPGRGRISRDALIRALRAWNVGTSVHFMPLHLHPYYRRAFGYRPEDFPAATAAFRRVLSLPLHTRMTSGDADYVARAVRAALEPG